MNTKPSINSTNRTIEIKTVVAIITDSTANDVLSSVGVEVTVVIPVEVTSIVVIPVEVTVVILILQ